MPPDRVCTRYDVEPRVCSVVGGADADDTRSFVLGGSEAEDGALTDDSVAEAVASEVVLDLVGCSNFPSVKLAIDSSSCGGKRGTPARPGGSGWNCLMPSL